MKKPLFILGLAMLSTEALAITQTNVTVGLAGIEGNGSQVFVGIDPNPNACTYGGVYFTVAAELNQVLSVALAAKMANKQIRVDYVQSAGNGTVCKGSSIYAQ
jgi:hypothetical protein